MDTEKLIVNLVEEDLPPFTVEDITCTNCIEGFCPARTQATCEQVSFTLCGAKKNSEVVLDAYQKRTGTTIHIERP